MSSLFGVPVDAAYNLVSALAAAFAPLLGGLAVAVAIIVFTMAVRLLVLPLSYYAFRGEKARARLPGAFPRCSRYRSSVSCTGSSCLTGSAAGPTRCSLTICSARRSVATGSARRARSALRVGSSRSSSCCSAW